MSEQASSSSTVPSKASTPVVNDVDIDKLLSREANAFQREMEVERILKAFKLKYVCTSYTL
jgi:DnaJ homolog subfamily C member 8